MRPGFYLYLYSGYVQCKYWEFGIWEEDIYGFMDPCDVF